MNRQYTNRFGEKVEVTKEHLDIAVQLKLELQRASYGRRCNWRKHQEYMVDNDHYDSCISESYRCLIKAYQKDTEQLQEVEKYADYVADGKLEGIKQVLGEVYSAKQDASKDFRALSKIKKEYSNVTIAIDELKDVILDNVHITVPQSVYKPRLVSNGNKLLAILSDWHIGAAWDVDGMKFDINIAQERMNKYIQEIVDYAMVFKVSDITVVVNGDLIEGHYMRASQAQYCDLDQADQINMATRMIFTFISQLAQNFNVEFAMNKGNHDRMEGNKNFVYEGDDATKVVLENVKTMVQMMPVERVTFIDNNGVDTKLNINGRSIKVIHGDTDKLNDNGKMAKHSDMDDILYDMMILSHLHHVDQRQGNGNKYTIYTGCLCGANTYSQKMKANANASQTMILFRDNGHILPIHIDLEA